MALVQGETPYVVRDQYFARSSSPYNPELMDSIQTLYQIQNISGAITDLAKSAQLNASDQGYVLRARNEIAQLSSLLISYSLSSSTPHELRTPKQEGLKDGSAQVESNKRKHKSISSQGQYCRSCGTTQTPEWRRGPDGGKSLCNACGLHYAKIIKREVLVPARKSETTAEAMNLRTLLN